MLISRGTGLIRCAPDPRDFVYVPDKTVGAANLPPTYTDLIPLKRVLDQGITQSCVACATAGGLWLKQRVEGVAAPVFPSPLVAYYDARRMEMGKGEKQLPDCGSTFYRVFRAYQEMGLADITHWPLDYMNLNEEPPWALRRTALDKTWLTYYRIVDIGPDRKETVKRVLVQERTAIPCGFDIDGAFEEWMPSQGPWKRKHTSVGLHGMLIIGYCQEGAYVLNSWGEAFGNDGVCLVSWETIEDEDECFDLFVPQSHGEVP